MESVKTWSVKSKIQNYVLIERIARSADQMRWHRNTRTWKQNDGHRKRKRLVRWWIRLWKFESIFSTSKADNSIFDVHPDKANIICCHFCICIPPNSELSNSTVNRIPDQSSQSVSQSFSRAGEIWLISLTLSFILCSWQKSQIQQKKNLKRLRCAPDGRVNANRLAAIVVPLCLCKDEINMEKYFPIKKSNWLLKSHINENTKNPFQKGRMFRNWIRNKIQFMKYIWMERGASSNDNIPNSDCSSFNCSQIDFQQWSW